MGCVTSKTDINDLHSNIFQVMNVDEMCNPLTAGQLEVSHSDLVLHQRGKAPVRWPLRCLRRYGCDAQLFSFECGRRCVTGPGIYAFQCARAETLFNLLQTRVQMRNNTAEDAVSNSTEPSIRPVESNYLEPAPVTVRQRISSSGGPLSPSSPPPLPPSTNNNCELKCVYTNIPLTPTSLDTLSFPDGDIQLIDEAQEEEEPSTPVYMNVIPGQEMVFTPLPSEPPPKPPLVTEADLEGRHCYANLEPGEVRMPPVTPPAAPNPQAALNYIQLDLEQPLAGIQPPSPQPHSPVTPSPTATAPLGYATIDFDRTEALCSVNNCPMVDEVGSRRTRHNSTFGEERPEERVAKRSRHNSTISELMAPLAARLSSSLSE